MVDPISLAVVTAEVAKLGADMAKGAAEKAGASLWSVLQQKIGITTEPDDPQLTFEVASKLARSQALIDETKALLEGSRMRNSGGVNIGSLKIGGNSVIVGGDAGDITTHQ